MAIPNSRSDLREHCLIKCSDMMGSNVSVSAFTELKDWYCTGISKAYRTTKPVIWEIDRKGLGFIISVPIGFEFDVSVPNPWLTWLLDVHDSRFLKAAALHDYLRHEMKWDRFTSAAAFNDGLKAESKLNKYKRMAMVFAVALYRWK